MEDNKSNEFARSLSQSDYDFHTVARTQKEMLKRCRLAVLGYLAGGLMMLGTTAYAAARDTAEAAFPINFAGDAAVAAIFLEKSRRETKKAWMAELELQNTQHLLAIIRSAKVDKQHPQPPDF